MAFLRNLKLININFLENILDIEESELVKLSTSIALAFIAREKTNDRVINVLIELFAKLDLLKKLNDLYDCWAGNAHCCLIINYLKYLKDEHILKLLQNAFEAIIDLHDYDGLLEIAFPHDYLMTQ